eukprot:GDKJ01003178.1.p1 GENE.GDKJ01003178.1~~GDKJ01003178.1.p1  ORF type:complete len:108 (-),score=1.61 GDKJ01003178.1:34-357(-)
MTRNVNIWASSHFTLLRLAILELCLDVSHFLPLRLAVPLCDQVRIDSSGKDHAEQRKPSSAAKHKIVIEREHVVLRGDGPREDRAGCHRRDAPGHGTRGLTHCRHPP